MGKINKFNVKQVAALTVPGIYSDGGGLHLRIRPSGTRSWVYIYRMDEKRREMGLGSYPEVTLARARERASQAREHKLDGVDPQRLRAQVKAQKPAEPPMTFGVFTLDWLDGIEGGFSNQKHRQQWRNTLTTYAANLFPLPIASVETTHVLEALQPIWQSKAETASRVRQRIERVLDAAKAKGLRSGENPAAWKGHLQLLLAPRSKTQVRHHPALPFRNMAKFMIELRKRPAVAARALEFTILTAARSGEVRGMKWGEINLESRVWTVPAERMKAKVIHMVPLSDAALSILLAIRPKDCTSDAIVFPAPRGGVMSDMALSALLKRMEQHDITVHGFRSTFRDWAGEATRHGREEVEMALAHTIESSVERAYRRGRALEKRKALMDDWAQHCAAMEGRS
jgi:integrase